MSIQISNNEVAVDHDYYWRTMETCPRGVKVQLLSNWGVAMYGNYNGRDEWCGWAPLPKRRRQDACTEG